MNVIVREFSGLPNFDDIGIIEVTEKLNQLLNRNREKLEQLGKLERPTWENFLCEIDQLANALDLFWSPIRHLNSVMNNPSIRDVYNAGLKDISIYRTEFGQNENIYNLLIKLEQSGSYSQFNFAQKKVIKDNLLSFRLNGVSLSKKNKIEFKDTVSMLSELTTQFEENILDCTNSWAKIIEDESILKGIPEHTMRAAKNRAKEVENAEYVLNLEFPTYHAIITFADDRTLRKELYKAYSTRASDVGPHDNKYNNDTIIKKIVGLRAKKARLLGFNNFAELSIEKKMVDSPMKVLSFLEELLFNTKSKALKEVSQLSKFAAELDGIAELEAWDIAYYSNKLKQNTFNFSDNELKPYFPANKVIEGMFAIVDKLYGLKIKASKEVRTWHNDVTFYEIKDVEATTRGGFYLDSFARESKRGGAWMDECVSRMDINGHLQLPVAYLTCNLTPPINDEQALFTHNEVITLFHEFGHGLHHMLTKINYKDISGISGVEWDAVELPSQFMENWCWQEEALSMISGHHQTDEKLPLVLLQKAKQAKNFQSGMQMLRQIEFAIFDMKLYMDSTENNIVDPQKLLDKIREKVSVVPTPKFNRFQNSFSHIFAGGYAAGYFSYKWAEVLSADAFSRFEAEGIFNKETGKDFLTKILEKGGSEKALDLFIEFMGRKPETEAILRQNGLLT